MRVKVYRNLHRRMWSIVNVHTGRVIGHAHAVVLADVSWRVQPAGNRKVRETGTKNVHAYGVGDLVSLDYNGQRERPVRYNPYTMTTFELDGSPIHESDVAYFTRTGAYV